MKGMGRECRVPSELMVLENHEFERLTEKLARCFSLRRNGEKFW